jgi:hypothetical protein
MYFWVSKKLKEYIILPLSEPSESLVIVDHAFPSLD